MIRHQAHAASTPPSGTGSAGSSPCCPHLSALSSCMLLIKGRCKDLFPARLCHHAHHAKALISTSLLHAGTAVKPMLAAELRSQTTCLPKLSSDPARQLFLQASWLMILSQTCKIVPHNSRSYRLRCRCHTPQSGAFSCCANSRARLHLMGVKLQLCPGPSSTWRRRGACRYACPMV